MNSTQASGAADTVRHGKNVPNSGVSAAAKGGEAQTAEARDAARYRWLKEHKTQTCLDDAQLGTFVNVSFLAPDVADLDAAIDAAMGAAVMKEKQ